MPNEPLVSVGSNNRIGNRNIIVVSIIPILAITTIAIIATWPYLHILGEILTLVLVTALLCSIYLCLLGVYHYHYILAARRRQAYLASWLVASGETAIYLRPDGSYSHVSAEHMLAVGGEHTIVQEVKSHDEEIIDRHIKGMAIRKIAKELGCTPYTVEKAIKEWKKRLNEAQTARNSDKTPPNPGDWRAQT